VMAETPFCIRDGLQSCAWLLKTPCPVDRHIKRACALHSKGFMCILWRTCFISFHDLAQGCGRLDCGVFSKISQAFSQVFTRTLCGLCLKRYSTIACRVCFRSGEMPQTFPHGCTVVSKRLAKARYTGYTGF
jgi:hypothetical protein